MRISISRLKYLVAHRKEALTFNDLYFTRGVVCKVIICSWNNTTFLLTRWINLLFFHWGKPFCPTWHPPSPLFRSAGQKNAASPFGPLRHNLSIVQLLPWMLRHDSKSYNSTSGGNHRCGAWKENVQKEGGRMGFPLHSKGDVPIFYALFREITSFCELGRWGSPKNVWKMLESLFGDQHVLIISSLL